MIKDAASAGQRIATQPQIVKGYAPKTDDPRPKLSIIVPTKDEAENVGKLIKRIEQATVGIPVELVFVDDSTDQTPEVISKLAELRRTSISLIRRPKYRWRDGLGGAVVEGMRACLGEWICVMDADLQHPPELLARMLERAESSNCDVVIASRYLRGGSAQGLGSPMRKLVSQAARCLAKALFLERLWAVSDPCSGFFLLRATLVEDAVLRPVGFKILTEVLMRTSWKEVEEIPYKFEGRDGGRSKATIAQGLGFLKHLVRLWNEVPGAGRFWKFALVGASGAAVNLGLLSILVVWIGLGRWLGWGIAVEGSIVWNFALAKNFAWADRQSRSHLRALISYHTVAGIGLAANALVFASLGLFGAHVLLAGFLGMLAGTITNYAGFDRLVFKSPAQQSDGLGAQLVRAADGGRSTGMWPQRFRLSAQLDEQTLQSHAGVGSNGDGPAAPGGTTGGLKKASWINRVIQTELKHIPRANPGSVQNELRMLYNFHRRRHLAIDPEAPAQQALFAAMQTLKGEYVVVLPYYDSEFFLHDGAGSLRRNGEEIS